MPKPKRCKTCGVFLVPEWDGDKARLCSYCSNNCKNGYKGREADGCRPVLHVPDDFAPTIEDHPEYFDAQGRLLPEEEEWEVDWEFVYQNIGTLMDTLDKDGTWFVWIKTINGNYQSSKNFEHYNNVRDWVLTMFGRQTPDDWDIWFCGDHIEFRAWSLCYKVYPSRWQAFSLTTKKYVTGRRMHIDRRQDHAAVQVQTSRPVLWAHPEDMDQDTEAYFPGEEFQCHFAFDTSLQAVDCYF